MIKCISSAGSHAPAWEPSIGSSSFPHRVVEKLRAGELHSLHIIHVFRPFFMGHRFDGLVKSPSYGHRRIFTTT